MQGYLKPSRYIDSDHPAIVAAAARICDGLHQPRDIAESCFIWVRDQVRHTGDYRDNTITCRASDVLEQRTGFCFAKSHLLAALLRAKGLPAGLCYQRLSRDNYGPPFCLHGLAAVNLPDSGWYRMDPRGNKPGVKAEFMPPYEQLAFQLCIPGEADLPEIWAEPLSIVVNALERSNSHREAADNFPDIELINHD